MQQAMILDTTLPDLLMQIKERAQQTRQKPDLTTVAEAAGLSRTEVSQIANRHRNATPAQTEKLWRALRELGIADEAEGTAEAGGEAAPAAGMIGVDYKKKVELYQTQEYTRAYGWLEQMRTWRKMGILVGHPGSGKTTILKEYARNTPEARYIECWSSMRMGDLMDELGAALNMTLSGNIYHRTMQVKNALQARDDVMLIFDETEQLRNEKGVNKFETLRKLWDNTQAPVVFAGTMQLREMITRGGGRDNLAQLYSRKLECELKGITDREARTILRDYDVAPEAVAELAGQATDKKHGGMRNFVQLLELSMYIAEGERITAGIVEEAKRYKMLY